MWVYKTTHIYQLCPHAGMRMHTCMAGWLAGWLDGWVLCLCFPPKKIYIHTHTFIHIHAHTQHAYTYIRSMDTYIHTYTRIPTYLPAHLYTCAYVSTRNHCSGVCVWAKRQHLTSSNGAPRPTKRQHALLTSRSLALKRPCQPCPGRELCLTNDRTVI